MADQKELVMKRLIDIADMIDDIYWEINDTKFEETERPKFKIGHWYLTRDKKQLHKFKMFNTDGDGFCWNSDGRLFTDLESNDDLVTELSPETVKLLGLED